MTRMKRKICCLLLCFIFTSSLFTNAYAIATPLTAEPLPGNATSIQAMFETAVSHAENSPATTTSCSESIYYTTLENSDGDSYDVQMFEYLPGSSSNGTTQTKTLVYSTSPEYVSPRAGHSQTNGGYDSSISVYGYITITYDVLPFNDYQDKYLLETVSGGWEKSENSVVMSDRYVSYTCQYILDSTQIDWKYPTGNTFSYDTGYDIYVPDDNTSTVMGAVSIVQLAHGSASRWDLTTRAYFIENDIGDIIFDII